MIQDIFPHVYHNEMKWKAPDADDLVLCFGAERVLYCRETDGAITLPRVADLPGAQHKLQYLFSITSPRPARAQRATGPRCRRPACAACRAAK